MAVVDVVMVMVNKMLKSKRPSTDEKYINKTQEAVALERTTEPSGAWTTAVVRTCFSWALEFWILRSGVRTDKRKLMKGIRWFQNYKYIRES